MGIRAEIRRGARKAALVSGAARWRARRRARKTPDAVFLWIPKTAGTSLWALLAAAGGGLYRHPTLVRWEFPGRGLASFGHQRYPDLVSAGLVSPRFDARAYKFAVVRNPFDRAVSLYHYLQAQGVLARPTSFAEFTAMLRERRYGPIGLYNHRGLSQCNPQVAWLVDDHGELIPDDIGRFEDMDAFVDRLRDRIGIAGALAHENRSPQRGRLGDYYSSPEVVDDVVTAYADDFAMLGYPTSP